MIKKYTINKIYNFKLFEINRKKKNIAKYSNTYLNANINNPVIRLI